MLKEQLCAAFCDRLTVAEVPSGYAVSTAFRTLDGDSIGFYIAKNQNGFHRLQDDGTTVPMMEALGVSLQRSDTRKHIFNSVLHEYGFAFEDETQTLHSEWFRDEGALADAALRFSAMLLRFQDLELLTPRIVEGAFREDAIAAIHNRFEGRVRVEEDAPFAGPFPNYLPDVVLRREHTGLAAIYLATSASSIDEAVMLHMELQLRNCAAKVILLLETPRPKGIVDRVLARAHNRLDALPVFKGQPDDAMEKIDVTVFGREAARH